MKCLLKWNRKMFDCEMKKKVESASVNYNDEITSQN